MKPPVFRYLRPESVEEAVSFKQEHGIDASILAGGQSLIPVLNFRLARPAVLIDITRVPDLDYTFLDDDAVVIGATRRQRDVELDERAVMRCPLLKDSLENVAHPTIRNRGTIGGTIAHADASAELPTALVALRGSVTATGPQGTRSIPAEEFFEFHLTNSLEPEELLTSVEFPNLPDDAGTAYLEIARRHGDYALAGVCGAMRLDEEGKLRDVRLGISGIAATPVRPAAAEEVLEGASPGDENILAEAGRLAGALVDSVDEEQASVRYRAHLVNVLLERTVKAAAEKANTRREA